MLKNKWIVGMFAGACVCGLFALWLGIHSTAQFTRYGATPTGEGIASLAVSVLGACGFSVAGIVNLVLHLFSSKAPSVTGADVEEIVELTESFAVWMKNKDVKSAQRRFWFALADESKHLPGVEISTDGGVLTIKYSGFADAPAA